MTRAEKLAALERLAFEWSACERCPLCTPNGRTRRNVVFGQGNPSAALLIVGEAPGADEDASGLPFQGASGELVDSFLKEFRSSREEVFIANIVGCRPTEEDNPKKNRAPVPGEVEACFPRIQQIIEIVDPFVVLMLGDTALKALSPEKRKITAVAEDPHKQQVLVSTLGRQMLIERTGFATYHPSYLLRNWSEAANGPVMSAYATWKKAFAVADMYEHLYRGVPLRVRES